MTPDSLPDAPGLGTKPQLDKNQALVHYCAQVISLGGYYAFVGCK
jgi:predicted amino acid dehydrogenase